MKDKIRCKNCGREVRKHIEQRLCGVYYQAQQRHKKCSFEKAIVTPKEKGKMIDLMNKWLRSRTMADMHCRRLSPEETKEYEDRLNDELDRRRFRKNR